MKQANKAAEKEQTKTCNIKLGRSSLGRIPPHDLHVSTITVLDHPTLMLLLLLLMMMLSMEVASDSVGIRVEFRIGVSILSRIPRLQTADGTADRHGDGLTE